MLRKEILKTLLISRMSPINIFLILFLFSCSHSDRANKVGKKELNYYKKKYLYQDKAGDFTMMRQSGFDAKKRFVTKYRLSEVGRPSEQAILFSQVSFHQKKIPVLKPESSVYVVWFDKKKYQVKSELNYDKKQLVLNLKSPEEKWNGVKAYPIPQNNGIYCFFSQIMECAKRIGFLDKAIRTQSGSMKFTIVWDGYPYIQEQYFGLANGPFEVATLKFDGKKDQKENRFSLVLLNNLIFYFVDKERNLEKMFWPAQGVSVLNQN
jgi:hypothetical protein